jgi:hypothetical protein
VALACPGARSHVKQALHRVCTASSDLANKTEFIKQIVDPKRALEVDQQGVQVLTAAQHVAHKDGGCGLRQRKEKQEKRDTWAEMEGSTLRVAHKDGGGEPGQGKQ